MNYQELNWEEKMLAQAVSYNEQYDPWRDNTELPFSLSLADRMEQLIEQLELRDRFHYPDGTL